MKQLFIMPRIESKIIFKVNEFPQQHFPVGVWSRLSRQARWQIHCYDVNFIHILLVFTFFPHTHTKTYADITLLIEAFCMVWHRFHLDMALIISKKTTTPESQIINVYVDIYGISSHLELT